jgi:hypothetical protein
MDKQLSTSQTQIKLEEIAQWGMFQILRKHQYYQGKPHSAYGFRPEE